MSTAYRSAAGSADDISRYHEMSLRNAAAASKQFSASSGLHYACITGHSTAPFGTRPLGSFLINMIARHWREGCCRASLLDCLAADSVVLTGGID
jgi:hypothetical protein